MNLFWLSKYFSFNLLLYFSLFSNIIYFFLAIYLFKIRTCNGLFCELDPYIYSLFYFCCCIAIIFILLITLLIEYFLNKSKKININHKSLTNKFLKFSIFSICNFCIIFTFFMFLYFLKFLLFVSSNID